MAYIAVHAHFILLTVKTIWDTSRRDLRKKVILLMSFAVMAVFLIKWQFIVRIAGMDFEYVLRRNRSTGVLSVMSFLVSV